MLLLLHTSQPLSWVGRGACRAAASGLEWRARMVACSSRAHMHASCLVLLVVPWRFITIQCCWIELSCKQTDAQCTRQCPVVGIADAARQDESECGCSCFSHSHSTHHTSAQLPQQYRCCHAAECSHHTPALRSAATAAHAPVACWPCTHSSSSCASAAAAASGIVGQRSAQSWSHWTF